MRVVNSTGGDRSRHKLFIFPITGPSFGQLCSIQGVQVPKYSFFSVLILTLLMRGEK